MLEQFSIMTNGKAGALLTFSGEGLTLRQQYSPYDIQMNAAAVEKSSNVVGILTENPLDAGRLHLL